MRTGHLFIRIARAGLSIEPVECAFTKRRDILSRMKLLLLPLLLLLSSLAFANDHPDGCDMWSHLEPTGNIECDWWVINGTPTYLCFADYECVNDNCTSVSPGHTPHKDAEQSGMPVANKDRT